MFSEYTVFGVGFPPLIMYLTAIPTVLAAYIVLFGDVLQSKSILKEADEARQDEKIDYDPNRAHLIFGAKLRNEYSGTRCCNVWAFMGGDACCDC